MGPCGSTDCGGDNGSDAGVKGDTAAKKLWLSHGDLVSEAKADTHGDSHSGDNGIEWAWTRPSIGSRLGRAASDAAATSRSSFICNMDGQVLTAVA